MKKLILLIFLFYTSIIANDKLSYQNCNVILMKECNISNQQVTFQTDEIEKKLNTIYKIIKKKEYDKVDSLEKKLELAIKSQDYKSVRTLTSQKILQMDGELKNAELYIAQNKASVAMLLSIVEKDKNGLRQLEEIHQLYPNDAMIMNMTALSFKILGNCCALDKPLNHEYAEKACQYYQKLISSSNKGSEVQFLYDGHEGVLDTCDLEQNRDTVINSIEDIAKLGKQIKVSKHELANIYGRNSYIYSKLAIAEQSKTNQKKELTERSINYAKEAIRYIEMDIKLRLPKIDSDDYGAISAIYVFLGDFKKALLYKQQQCKLLNRKYYTEVQKHECVAELSQIKKLAEE